MNQRVNDKAADVVRAATAVFLRYGFARTTMGDIATAGGISRPSLYLLFPSKEDVFSAVVRQMDRDWHATIDEQLDDHVTLEQKLRHVCREWAAHGIDTVAKHPDAKDLFDLSFEAVREMYDHFEERIATLIHDAVGNVDLDATPAELARSLIYAMRGIKDAARSTADMRRLADVQVSLLIAALELPQTPPPRRTRKRS